jgi:lipoprotein signal peptidase
MSFLPVNTRRLGRNLSRTRRSGGENEASAALALCLRRMLIVALLVLTADWGSKAILLRLSPGSTIPHYTHPNPLAFLLVLAIAPLILRVINSPLMMVGLGVAIGGCAGNLFERMLGMPVTDFIPLPHLLASPSCHVGQSCVLMFNVADLALWGSVPLLALAFIWHVLDHAGSRRSVTA